MAAISPPGASARQAARPLRELAHQQRGLVHLRILAARVVGKAHGVAADGDRVAQRRAWPRAQCDASVGRLLELARHLARADQLVAGDLAQLAAVARDVAVIGHAQREASAADRTAACDPEEVSRGLATTGGDDGQHGEEEAPHAATATPPRRGSPAPVRAPVAGSRSTAWTPPKNRFCARNGLTTRPARRSRSSSIPGSVKTMPSSKCSRGASTASRAPRPRSTTPTIVCRIADRILLEPALPTTSSTPSG